NIVRRQWESQPKGSRPPVVVVSALSKVTDGLIRTTELARNGDSEKATALVMELLSRHVAIARTLTSGQRAESLVAALNEQFGQLAGRAVGMAMGKNVTPAHHDLVVASGELASSRIVAAAFEEQGLPAIWVDAREVLVTDGEHMAAVPDMDATCRK